MSVLAQTKNIIPRGAGLAPTFNRARSHLSWVHVPTPFSSVYNEYRLALRKAGQLQINGVQDVYIVVIDMYTVQDGELLNAFAIGKAAGFTSRHTNPRMRLENHRGEYLFYGGISVERILAVIPATGVPRYLNVHLGILTVPLTCLQIIGTEEGDEAVWRLKTGRGLLLRHQEWDEF